ncbi:MAG: hypothetical protein IOD08_11695 [Bradyrhizobium sp.]|uniref:TadE/TadG family type IV pilus assembly protein n=1 Tax=Bradyrhizobium sp. TaxID=376 RepID=UPI0025C687C2|nr:hypothetical protein [Bradyrhizobium sp.]MCA3577933.1 hypothetical protein [Bradyrhizobium sp.]
MHPLIRPFAPLARQLRRLRRDRRGVSVLEFGLMTPIVTGMLMAGTDLVMFSNAHQEVSRLATSTADLASRYRASIDEKDIATLFLGGRMAITGIDFGEHGRLILSSVTRNSVTPSTGHWIRWQRCFGKQQATSRLGAEDAGRTTTDIPNVGGMTLNDGDNVMFVEATYEYQPMFFDGVVGERTITYSAAYMAREIALTGLTNTTNIATANRKLCTYFTKT